MKFRIKYFLYVFLLLFFSSIWAKNISFYEQPKADAKVLGEIDPTSGFIPIFKPKNSVWIKIADPRNGNVGWIKTSNFPAQDDKTRVIFSEQIISKNGNQTKAYQVLSNGVVRKLSDKEIQEAKQAMEKQQRYFQREMHTWVQEINYLFAEPHSYFPFMMPVVIFPKETKLTKLPPSINHPSSELLTTKVASSCHTISILQPKNLHRPIL